MVGFRPTSQLLGPSPEGWTLWSQSIKEKEKERKKNEKEKGKRKKEKEKERAYARTCAVTMEGWWPVGVCGGDWRGAVTPSHRR